MRKNMKSIIAMLLVVMSMTAMVFGCKNDTGNSSQNSNPSSNPDSSAAGSNATNEDGVTPAGELPIVTEQTTLSVMLPQNANINDLVDNDFTHFVEEQTNIKLDMQISPADGYDEKLNLALSTGTYPEVILYGAAGSNLDIVKYGMTEKIYIPMNDYIEKYSVNIKQIWEDIPTIKESMTAPDGNVYVIPRSEGAAGHGSISDKFWINTAWIQQLGKSVPTTTEEFKDVLIAFRDEDPNGNGQKDEVPLSGAANTWAADPYLFIMNAFCHFDGGIKMFKDGVFSSPVTTDAFKNGLKYLAELYDEGLIDPAAFTQDLNSLLKLGNAEPTVLGSFGAGHLAMGIDITNRELADQYEALMPLKGPDGYQGTPVYDSLYTSGGRAAITDKCEKPAVAFRLLDFFCDGYVVNRMDFGPENESWAKADPGATGVTGLKAEWKMLSDGTNYSQLSNSKTWGIGMLFPADWKAKLQFEGDILDAENYEARLIRDTAAYAQYRGEGESEKPMWADADTATALSNQAVPINDYVKSAIVAFITGQKDIDAEWDAYLADLEKLGLSDYIAAYQKTYDESNK